ncbi:hypothetical protein GW796_05295 [archaeon]|nr:hypothetical protein [archaeon]NCQ51299.1 hypothetical protein [archaeon]
MSKIKSIYIKYKFMFKDDINRSSYLYQKVFRSIYGYQQNVTKKNNKPYLYIRKGILTDIPHYKPGRNAVIIPKGYENKIIDYFSTGINPAHNWKSKGDWDVKYTVDEIDLDSSNIIKIMEDYIYNYKIINLNNKETNIYDELKYITENNIYDKNHLTNISKIVENIINFEWFKEVKEESEKLIKFYNNYLEIKNKI